MRMDDLWLLEVKITHTVMHAQLVCRPDLKDVKYFSDVLKLMHTYKCNLQL